MTKNLDTSGIKLIVSNYELFFIDIWGVVHIGVHLFNDSIKVLNELEKLNKEYVLLTNAPRPNFSVRQFLEKMGMHKNYSNKKETLMLHAYKINFSIANTKYSFSADIPTTFKKVLKEKYLKIF